MRRFERSCKPSDISLWQSSVELVAKVNAVPVESSFYADTRKWHVTFGDSDQDR